MGAGKISLIMDISDRKVFQLSSLNLLIIGTTFSSVASEWNITLSMCKFWVQAGESCLDSTLINGGGWGLLQKISLGVYSWLGSGWYHFKSSWLVVLNLYAILLQHVAREDAIMSMIGITAQMAMEQLINWNHYKKFCLNQISINILPTRMIYIGLEWWWW